MDMKQVLLDSVKANINLKGLAKDVVAKIILAYIKELAVASPNKIDDMVVAMVEAQVGGAEFEAFLDKILGDLAK